LVLYRRHADAITSRISNASRRRMMRWFMSKYGADYSPQEKKAFRDGIRNSMIRSVLAGRKTVQPFGERVRGGLELIQARAPVSEWLAQASYAVFPGRYRKQAADQARQRDSEKKE
jgi:hypothetical protein